MAAIVAIASCNKLGGSKDNDNGSAAVATTGNIKVGHYASMTGAELTFGVSTDQGIRLAVEERNKAGGVKGRQIELITLDTASKASEGGTVVTRLITDDHVVALLGEVSSSITLAGGDVAQKLGVPDISPSSTNVRVTELGDMVSRVCFTDDFQAWVLAKFVRENLKLDKVAVLYDQSQAYSKGLAEYFRKSFVDLGGKIVADEAYAGGNPDASAQLQNISASGAQALFLPGYYGDAGNFMKQAKQKGITIPFIGSDGWDSADLIKIAGEAANGNYYSTHYSVDENRPEVKAFVAAYQAKFHGQPDALAALGYDAARVLFDAMDRAPTLDGKTLAATIAATKDFPGVTGLITMDAKRNAQKKAVVLKIEDRKPRLVADIWPPGMEPAAAGAGSAAPAAGSGSAVPAAGSGSAAAAAGSGSAAKADDAAGPITTSPSGAKGGAIVPLVTRDAKDSIAAPKQNAAPKSGTGGQKEDPEAGGE